MLETPLLGGIEGVEGLVCRELCEVDAEMVALGITVCEEAHLLD